MDNKERRNEMAEGKHAMEKEKKEISQVNQYVCVCYEKTIRRS